jgi:hypothetical protein
MAATGLLDSIHGKRANGIGEIGRRNAHQLLPGLPAGVKSAALNRQVNNVARLCGGGAAPSTM